MTDIDAEENGWGDETFREKIRGRHDGAILRS